MSFFAELLFGAAPAGEADAVPINAATATPAQILKARLHTINTPFPSLRPRTRRPAEAAEPRPYPYSWEQSSAQLALRCSALRNVHQPYSQRRMALCRRQVIRRECQDRLCNCPWR